MEIRSTVLYALYLDNDPVCFPAYQVPSEKGSTL